MREDKHTLGPLQRCGHDQGGCICRAIWSTTADRPIAIVGQKPEEWLPLSDEEADDDCRLIAAAYSSYDKHCGKYAVQCAEEDLLGEALGAMRLADEAFDMVCDNASDREAFERWWIAKETAQEAIAAVLAKTGGNPHV